MNCRNIQDLILTDFMDEETSEDVRRRIKEHLERCDACRAFEAAVRATAVRPLEAAGRAEVPARLWPRITSRIYADGLRPAAAGPLERIKNFFFRPRPVFVLSSVAALALFAVLAVRLPYLTGRVERQRLAERALEEEVDYFAYGNGGTDMSGLDTGIEEIFS
ncbi:MAG: anti-sigma factor family protein [Deltaproteobacteria bacterium]